MKTLSHYIQEKLIIKKSKTIDYNYFPQTKQELQNIILKRIEQEGNEVDLNDIDVSKITDMSNLFANSDFNGNISNWDVSNVKDMSYMFDECESFNQDISKWDVSKVIYMMYMFSGCESFNQDISSWDISNKTETSYMFADCPIEEKYKPKFK